MSADRVKSAEVPTNVKEVVARFGVARVAKAVSISLAVIACRMGSCTRFARAASCTSRITHGSCE